MLGTTDSRYWPCYIIGLYNRYLHRYFSTGSAFTLHWSVWSVVYGVICLAQPGPSPACSGCFSVNWFALRLYTFMVVVVAMAARHRRRSYRNDETGPRPGTTHCWLLARILELELSRLTSVHWPGGSSTPGRGNTATLTALRRRRWILRDESISIIFVSLANSSAGSFVFRSGTPVLGCQ